MALVGEAEITITANTAPFQAELAAAGDTSFAPITAKAEKAGNDIGLALSDGVSSGTKGLADNVGKDAEAAGGKLSSAFEEAGNKAKGALSGFGIPEVLLTGWGAAAVGIAAVGAIALDAAAKMQDSVASIATSAGITIKQANDIGNAFLATSGETEYSGQQQAAAFALVAGQLKATEGQALTTSQSLQVMKAATDLASASGGDLSSTTQALAATMQAFQIPTKGAADASNILFNTANATGQSVESVGASLDKLKAKLGDTAPPISELAATMVDLTNNGITGRAALTAVNTAMTSLVGAATGTTTANKAAAQTLADYGISATQANGQLTPMSKIIADLAPKFATMTQAQQLATASQIFGASAAKDMVVAIDAGSASFDKATASVTNNNAVQDAAALKAKTLSGQFDIIKSTASNFATELGEDLQPILTELLSLLNTLIPIIGQALKVAFQVLNPIINATVALIKDTVNVMTGLINFVVDIFEGKWGAAWNMIKSGASNALNFILNLPDEILKAFESLPSGLTNLLKNVGDIILEPFVNAINAIIDVYNKIPLVPNIPNISNPFASSGGISSSGVGLSSVIPNNSAGGTGGGGTSSTSGSSKVTSTSSGGDAYIAPSTTSSSGSSSGSGTKKATTTKATTTPQVDLGQTFSSAQLAQLAIQSAQALALVYNNTGGNTQDTGGGGQKTGSLSEQATNASGQPIVTVSVNVNNGAFSIVQGPGASDVDTATMTEIITQVMNDLASKLAASVNPLGNVSA